MTTDSETNNTPNSRTTRHQKSAGISRRQIMVVGGAGLAGLAAVATGDRADANTQQPIAAAQGQANPNGKFANKVVLITGATSGIGEATARAFAKEGATVHFCGRREALGAKVAQEINAMGGRGSYQKADVRNEQDVKSFIDTCVQKYGRLDIAFNNAGIESPPKTIEEMTLDDWNNVMATNITGIFGVSQFSFITPDLLAVREELVRRDIAIVWEFENAELGLKFLFIRDPNGNLIQYIQRFAL